MRNWRMLLLPDLQRFAPEHRADAIRNARDTELDTIELAGAGLALLLAAWATRYALPADAEFATRVLACVVNLGLALPLVLAVFLPFHVRRLRRGLRDQLARRQGAR